MKKISHESNWPFKERHFAEIKNVPRFYSQSSLSSLVLRPYVLDSEGTLDEREKSLRRTFLLLLEALGKKYRLILPLSFDPELFRVKSYYGEYPKFGFKWVGIDFLANFNVSVAQLRKDPKVHFLPHIEILSAALLFDWPASMGRTIENRNGSRRNVTVPYVYLGGCTVSFDGGNEWGTPFLMSRENSMVMFGIDKGVNPSRLFSVPIFCHRERS